MKIQLSDHFNYKKLLRFTLPSILMMIYTSIYGELDGFFISNFAGKTEFAAVNFIMPVIMIVGGLGFMIGTGGSAIVARTLGEGRREKANEYFSMMIYVTVVLGLVVAVLGEILLRPVTYALGAEGDMAEYCILYGRISFLSIMQFMLQNVFQSFFVTAQKPQLGLAVIMDLVHSHYVRNLNEGINELDGTDHLYSPAGPAGDQPHWDSKLFDYGKPQVEHFLLSNIKYWLEEYRFDGFRFDGVTSMLYHHHGYVAFDSRDRYFDEGVNEGAITYLSLANRLAHDLRPSCVTIAEDVSGMPGICFPQEEGGVGFDYRLGMAIPDYWIKQIEEVPDEQWDIREMWSVMTDRLPGVKTVAYAESHDQALVGDKTIAFRLMDKEMYTHMDRASENLTIDRGMALHKMIRLMTVSTGGDAYLNFMGNEFGHPEWIDFPREGNGWSYAHARRQWSLAEDGLLRYSWLGAFDRAMLALVKRYGILRDGYPYCLQMDDRNQTIAFSHGRLVFVFNWHPAASIPDYRCRVREAGRYELILSTDERRFGGTERARIGSEHFSSPTDNGDGTTSPAISIYNTSRTAAVYLCR